MVPRLNFHQYGRVQQRHSISLPFSPSGSALLFHLLSKLYERTSVVITTNLSFSEWAGVFGEELIRQNAAVIERLVSSITIANALHAINNVLHLHHWPRCYAATAVFCAVVLAGGARLAMKKWKKGEGRSRGREGKRPRSAALFMPDELGAVRTPEEG